MNKVWRNGLFLVLLGEKFGETARSLLNLLPPNTDEVFGGFFYVLPNIRISGGSSNNFISSYGF